MGEEGGEESKEKRVRKTYRINLGGEGEQEQTKVSSAYCSAEEEESGRKAHLDPQQEALRDHLLDLVQDAEDDPRAVLERPAVVVRAVVDRAAEELGEELQSSSEGREKSQEDLVMEEEGEVDERSRLCSRERESERRRRASQCTAKKKRRRREHERAQWSWIPSAPALYNTSAAYLNP